jgi:hypothetical protein
MCGVYEVPGVQLTYNVLFGLVEMYETLRLSESTPTGYLHVGIVRLSIYTTKLFGDAVSSPLTADSEDKHRVGFEIQYCLFPYVTLG